MMLCREMQWTATATEALPRPRYRGTAWGVYLAALSTWPSMTSSTWTHIVMASASDFYIRCRHITTPVYLVTTSFSNNKHSLDRIEDEFTRRRCRRYAYHRRRAVMLISQRSKVFHLGGGYACFISWPTFVAYLSTLCLEWDNVP